ncbi:MAG: LytR C-terminal domain-containing protein [Ignavibacteria bacterium]|nr:LytR C-terminal domain-containing protein [Ignavibacteria bacterium]
MNTFKKTGAPEGPAPRRDPARIGLNILIAILLPVVLYLSYAFVQRTFIDPSVETMRDGETAGGIIQIDVLNGCGDPGMASKCSGFLRERGFDVVEMRNYRTFDVDESLVIDRAGDRGNAIRVARVLGVSDENIIQQINEDYYVDVSVVIGKDYGRLRPYK